MKTQLSNVSGSKLETIRRGLYAFQVLVVGLAIPLLFALGISNDTVKKTTPVENVSNVSNDINTAGMGAIEFHVPEI